MPYKVYTYILCFNKIKIKTYEGTAWMQMALTNIFLDNTAKYWIGTRYRHLQNIKKDSDRGKRKKKKKKNLIGTSLVII